MGRPTKRKLDYFPLDCEMDDSIEYIEAECGLIGFAILIKLYQKIYGDKGFYAKWNEKKAALFCKREGCTQEQLYKVLDIALAEGIFSDEKYKEFGILTSAGIQRRYLAIVGENRRSDIITEDEEGFLIGKSNKKEFSGEKPEFTPGKPEFVSAESAQMKGKEGKETEIKEKENLPPSVEAALDEFAQYRKEIKKPFTARARSLAIAWLYKIAAKDNELDEAKAVAIIQQSISRGWTGLFDIKGKSPPRASSGTINREYDMAELEKALVAKTRRNHEEISDYSGSSAACRM